jgi:hypothetical protein
MFVLFVFEKSRDGAVPLAVDTFELKPCHYKKR